MQFLLMNVVAGIRLPNDCGNESLFPRDVICSERFRVESLRQERNAGVKDKFETTTQELKLNLLAYTGAIHVDVAHIDYAEIWPDRSRFHLVASAPRANLQHMQLEATEQFTWDMRRRYGSYQHLEEPDSGPLTMRACFNVVEGKGEILRRLRTKISTAATLRLIAEQLERRTRKRNPVHHS